ncbi:MAG: hypothetical protein QOE61_3133 [Micromonosporaceae bacterium]|nr:hypothetical protein [Micromonosporaceae bacterium]
MTPSQDLYGRIRLAFLFHDSDAETHSAVMEAWVATKRDATVSLGDLPPYIQRMIQDLEASPVRVSPQAELHYRLSDTLGAHDAHPEDQMVVRHAYMAAGMDDATWDDLPADIQARIDEIEKLPRTSWDDPMDALDDTSYMDG